MSNTAKGMIAGLIATLVVSVLMLLNGSLDLIPAINVIQLLMSLGTLSAPSAWMDHFIVGVVVWGLLFAVYDSATTRPALWLKGIIFGMFAWADNDGGVPAIGRSRLHRRENRDHGGGRFFDLTSHLWCRAWNDLRSSWGFCTG